MKCTAVKSRRKQAKTEEPKRREIRKKRNKRI